MAELQQKTALEVDDGFVCRDHEGYVERMKAQAWGQEDLALAQNHYRSGMPAYDRTKRWKHARSGRLAAPELHEQRRWTFEEMAAEPIGPAEGMPQVIDVGALKFNDREVACVRGDRSRSMATMLWGSKGFDQAALGQEVNELFQWLHLQSRMVEPISKVALPVMLELQGNGILDDDFEVVGLEHIDALVYDVARSGRVDRYPDGQAVHATDMLKASGALLEAEIEAGSHRAQIQQFEGRIDGLRLRVQSAGAALDAWYRRRAMKAEEREVAGLIRERENVNKWIDGIQGMVNGCAGVIKGIATASPTDVVTGGAGVVASATKLIVHHAYEGQIDEAFARIGQLRDQAEAFEARELIRNLQALRVELLAFQEFVRRMGELSTWVEDKRAGAHSVFGSHAAGALRAMSQRDVGRDNPFAADSKASRARIQRLFANVPTYERVLTLEQESLWPRLTGDMPMSSYLFWTNEQSLLVDFAQEAAKLRWWKARISGVAGLLRDTTHASGSIAEMTRSTR